MKTTLTVIDVATIDLNDYIESDTISEKVEYLTEYGHADYNNAYGTNGYVEIYDEESDLMLIELGDENDTTFGMIQDYDGGDADVTLYTNHPELLGPLVAAELAHFDTEVNIVYK